MTFQFFDHPNATINDRKRGFKRFIRLAFMLFGARKKFIKITELEILTFCERAAQHLHDNKR